MDPYQIVRAVAEGEEPPFPPNTNKDFKRLVRNCWDAQPQNRPLFPAILQRLESFKPSDFAK
jgi:hypothetical protein